MPYECLCDKTFDELPPNAKPVHSIVRKCWTLYQCGREVHDLKLVKQPPVGEIVGEIAPTPSGTTMSPASPVLVAVEAMPTASEPSEVPPGKEEWVDAICTKYEPAFGDGMLKIERQFRSPIRYWLRFRVEDVVSEGRIHINGLVHCLVDDTEPPYPGACPRARQISLYRDIE